MTLRIDLLEPGVPEMVVRDGRQHMVEEAHVVPPNARHPPQIMWGDRILSLGVFRDLIRGALTLLAFAEELDREYAGRHRR